MSDLQRLLGFCRHCDETGCLEWTGGMGGARKETPIFHFSGTRQNKKSMAAYRAHWILAGKQLRQGERVFRKCGNERCVSIEPGHCSVGQPKQMWAVLKKDGRFKDVHARRLANVRNRANSITPEPIVKEVEQRLERGDLQKHIARDLHLSKDLVLLIKRGQHFHSTARVRVLPGASVFALGAQP